MASTGFEDKFLGGERRENYASDSEEEEEFKDALDDTLRPAEDGLPQVSTGLAWSVLYLSAMYSYTEPTYIYVGVSTDISRCVCVALARL